MIKSKKIVTVFLPPVGFKRPMSVLALLGSLAGSTESKGFC